MHNEINTSTGVAYAASGGTAAIGTGSVLLGFDIGQVAAAVGCVFVVLTYFTNVFFQYRRDKREQTELEHNIRDNENGL